MRKIVLMSILLGLLPFIHGCALATTYGKTFEQAQA